MPTRSGYTFHGWFSVDYAFAVGSMVREGMVLTARWTPSGNPSTTTASNPSTETASNPSTETAYNPSTETASNPSTSNPSTAVATNTAVNMAFDDVLSIDWFYRAVAFVSGRGIIPAQTYRRFEPNAGMSRGTYAQALANLGGTNTMPWLGETTGFYDVYNGSRYIAAINWAVSEGLMNSVAPGYFGPYDLITREQMVQILYNYAQLMGVQLPWNETGLFADQWSVSPWASYAVRAMHAAGIISARPDGTFDPQGIATRADIALLLSMFADVAW